LHSLSFLLLIENYRTCNENPCPSWTPWTGWSECSLTCGGGKRTRTRKCSLPASGAAVSGSNSQKLFCPGNESETEDCNKNKCPGKKIVFKVRAWFYCRLELNKLKTWARSSLICQNMSHRLFAISCINCCAKKG